jgi:hypothetical protein
MSAIWTGNGAGDGDSARLDLRSLRLQRPAVTMTAPALAVACLVVAVYGLALRGEEREVGRRAQLVSAVGVPRIFRRSDFAGVTAARRAQLLERLREALRSSGFAGAAVYDRPGRLVVATAAEPGDAKTREGAAIRRAMRGTAAVVTHEREEIDGARRPVLATIVPVRLGRARAVGAIVLWTRYSTIEASVRHTLLPFALAVPALFLAWFGVIGVHRIRRGR